LVWDVFRYSVWAAFTGLVVGMLQKLGEVRDFKDIRQQFMKTPENFTQR
jgi:hypothetical protein